MGGKGEGGGWAHTGEGRFETCPYGAKQVMLVEGKGGSRTAPTGRRIIDSGGEIPRLRFAALGMTFGGEWGMGPRACLDEGRLCAGMTEEGMGPRICEDTGGEGNKILRLRCAAFRMTWGKERWIPATAGKRFGIGVL